MIVVRETIEPLAKHLLEESYRRDKEAMMSSRYLSSEFVGLGAYKLMTSNDLNETGSPDWKDIIGPDALRDIGQFLGVDFFQSGSGR